MSKSELRLVISVGVDPDPVVIARNADRLALAKILLGKRYLLHPANRIARTQASTARQ